MFSLYRPYTKSMQVDKRQVLKSQKMLFILLEVLWMQFTWTIVTESAHFIIVMAALYSQSSTPAWDI